MASEFPEMLVGGTVPTIEQADRAGERGCKITVSP